jgi:hypothetical protein
VEVQARADAHRATRGPQGGEIGRRGSQLGVERGLEAGVEQALLESESGRGEGVRRRHRRWGGAA